MEEWLLLLLLLSRLICGWVELQVAVVDGGITVAWTGKEWLLLLLLVLLLVLLGRWWLGSPLGLLWILWLLLLLLLLVKDDRLDDWLLHG